MKTKNYIKYKKKWFIDANGEKNAPFNLYIENAYGEIKTKIIELAKRNSGVKLDALMMSGDLNFDFFTEKGVKTFVRKVRARYSQVEVFVVKAIPLVDVTYVDYEV